MNRAQLVTFAHQVIKRDAKLLSYDNVTLFWNEFGSGIDGQEQQNYNLFHRLDCIYPEWIKSPQSPSEMDDIVNDYNEFIEKLREQSANGKRELKTFRAAQMAFIFIINAALKFCPL